jgi:hypothetical protein
MTSAVEVIIPRESLEFAAREAANDRTVMLCNIPAGAVITEVPRADKDGNLKFSYMVDDGGPQPSLGVFIV